MVLISKSALKSNKRNEARAIIHDFMNNLADPDSNNASIYSSQYLGPAFYQKSNIHVPDKFAIALSISLGILVLYFSPQLAHGRNTYIQGYHWNNCTTLSNVDFTEDLLKKLFSLQ
jgi:hypothetical protein